MVKEINRDVSSGYVALLALVLATGGTIFAMVRGIQTESVVQLIISSVVFTLVMIGFAGFFMVDPNEARVLQLFGKYVGTARLPGLRYANPFYGKKRLSLRVRNFETEMLKVNDAHGNPVEIAAVVVWQVIDTAEALFEVDDYQQYVRVQSESALRGLATKYPYDVHEEGETALSTHLTEVAAHLQTQIQNRLDKAGVKVIEARISHLAYAPEIASAMLQRQQASAIIAARKKIVEGAVSMVEMALDSLSDRDVVQLDEERKATMVSNLLVILCGDRAAQPVINAGTL
ncbi:MAG: SPFH domain-containing protein [Gemmatimonadetes bacterium]|nr:SPFH domain-containing protein [Gemmatimonadota bacterium]